MEIVICGSMTFSKDMLEISEKLKDHETILPPFTKKYARLDSKEDMHKESAKNKIKHDLIKKYFKKIKKSDAVLVVNENKKEIENYIGANSLIEMAFAHVLDKKIFLLNPIPEMNYTDEIGATHPTILNGDLSKIK